jgi:hypothetical protein
MMRVALPTVRRTIIVWWDELGSVEGEHPGLVFC